MIEDLTSQVLSHTNSYKLSCRLFLLLGTPSYNFCCVSPRPRVGTEEICLIYTFPLSPMRHFIIYPIILKYTLLRCQTYSDLTLTDVQALQDTLNKRHKCDKACKVTCSRGFTS